MTPKTTSEALERLYADALEVFDGPECPQIARDVIEWYASSVRAALQPTGDLEGGEARPIKPNLGDTYEPCMDINAKPGTVVRFRAGGGYEWEKKHALEAGFVLNALYTVKRCDIGHSKTEVLIDGMEGRWNSCLFSDATQPRALVLSGYQLREAMTFIAPDGTDDQMEQEVCIAMRPAGVDMDGEHYEAGLCCWMQEYPEEGSIPLDGKCDFSSPHQPATAGGEPEIHAALRAAGLMLVRTQNGLRVEKAVDIVAGARAVVQKAVEQPGVPVEIPVPLSAAIKDHIKTSLAASDHPDGEKGPSRGAIYRATLDRIAGMDPDGVRADDLGKAARLARESANPAGEPSAIAILALERRSNMTDDEALRFGRSVLALASAPAPSPVQAWEYQNMGGDKFLTHRDPNKWHPHDKNGFKEFRPLVYAATKPEPAGTPVFESIRDAASAVYEATVHAPVVAHETPNLSDNAACGSSVSGEPASAPSEGAKCSRCDNRRWVEEGDPELGGNIVPCELCWNSEPTIAADSQREEDAFVIKRMGELLARIAVIVNGPEPARRCWGYTDLPEKVAELAAFRQAALDPENQPSQFGTTLAPTAPALQKGVTDAARDVLAERQRQVDVEGWTPEHDNEHPSGELALAAWCYVGEAHSQLNGISSAPNDNPPGDWPWEELAWKPKDPRRNLVKAGALIIAEIERIDRALASSGKEGDA